MAENDRPDEPGAEGGDARSAGDAEPRQILAGISEHYDPADLVGRSVVIVANLKPRKLMGLESQGMVLAASDDDGLSVLVLDKEVAPGSRAK